MKQNGDISFLRIIVHALLLRPFLKLFCGVNIVGRENLKNLDRYIIIANHNSHLDVPLLFYLLPLKAVCRTHPVAAEEYFSKSRLVFRLVTFLFAPIWIVRGHPGQADEPFKDIKDLINRKHNIIIFPEGTRGKPGEMQHFKSGIGRLVSEYPDISIVPVFLTGPERALPKASSLLLPFWNNIIVGPPQRCKGSHRDITHYLEGILGEISLSESARRHKRRSRDRKRSVSIAVLGIDGSGKSTLSRSIAENLSRISSACLISDELTFYEQGSSREIQPLISEKLRELVSSYAKKAKSLKFYKIPKLTELFLRDHLFREVRRWYLPNFIVMDGSPLLNMAAWAVLYKKDALDEKTWATAIGILAGKEREAARNDPIFAKFKELKMIKRLKLNNLSLPDVTILLDVTPTTACHRINSRGERKQAHETEEHLGRLREAYIKVCHIIRERWDVPTNILDGEKSLETTIKSAMEFVQDSLKQRN